MGCFSRATTARCISRARATLGLTEVDGQCPPDFFLNPFFSFSAEKEKNGFNLPRKGRRQGANRCPEFDSENISHQPSVASDPTTRKVSALCASRRQKKPAAFRFRRGGESSISAGSFFLSESRPLRWVAFRLILEKKENLRNRKWTRIPKL